VATRTTGETGPHGSRNASRNNVSRTSASPCRDSCTLGGRACLSSPYALWFVVALATLWDIRHARVGPALMRFRSFTYKSTLPRWRVVREAQGQEASGEGCARERWGRSYPYLCA
jgi:hypothetical protein